MRVLVCDDQKDRAMEASEAIHRSGIDAEVEELVEGALTEALHRLFKRVESGVKDPIGYDLGEKLEFDDYDLVIFDNNLAELKIASARLTAESMVGYVRAFSNCPYCVSLNKNPDVDFDLRYLVGDYETRADLALNTRHLSNLGLWTGRPEDAEDGFLPWYWPALSEAPARRREQVTFIQEHLDQRILSALGLPTDELAIGFLSLHGQGALVPNKRAAEWSFIDVFRERDRSLPAETKEDREGISKAVEREHIASLVARVVAADVDLWFRRDLVAPQEMLIDIPHLVMRMPFLLAGDTSDPKVWNDAATCHSAPFGLKSELYSEHLEWARFQKEVWVQRPVFLWPSLKENEALDELFFEWASKEMEVADVVFCEDRSVFSPRAAAGTESTPKEFGAEFEGAWTRRFVAKVDGYGYRPLSRFAA